MNAHLKPSALAMLNVLRDHPGEWISVLDFKRGTFGFHLDACAQRFRELVLAGLPVISTGRGGHAPASYKYIGIPAPVSVVPTVDEFDGALFDLSAHR